MATFDLMSAIGATPAGGVHRLALTEEDRQARELLWEWCKESGYPVQVDRIGNMFATRSGTAPEAPPFLIGSHLDSQPHAGRYDGPVGVLAALEVLRSLDDLGIETGPPVQLVNWTNEEGARFAPPLIGSGVFARLHDLAFALSLTDRAGVRLRDALAEIGYDGTSEPGWPVCGYVEAHIEQGTVLERAEVPIGVVTEVVGILDLRVMVTGQTTHAGPMPMEERRDALVGAAEMILVAREVGLRHAPEARVTVGRIVVPSDSHSVVPGVAEFVVDLRHPDGSDLAALRSEVLGRFDEIAQAHRLKVSCETLFSFPPTPFDPGLRDAVRQSASALGYASRDLPSRAGHDAWNIAQRAPAALVFIPCHDGISHNEAEYADPAHIAAGADVLLNTVIAACT